MEYTVACNVHWECSDGFSRVWTDGCIQQENESYIRAQSNTLDAQNE